MHDSSRVQVFSPMPCITLTVEMKLVFSLQLTAAFQATVLHSPKTCSFNAHADYATFLLAAMIYRFPFQFSN